MLIFICTIYCPGVGKDVTTSGPGNDGNPEKGIWSHLSEVQGAGQNGSSCR